MNKMVLIEELKRKTNLTKIEAKKVVDLFFDKMSNALANGDRVEIRGLCSFYVKHYKAYTGRNPKTGKTVQVTAKKLPFFKCSPKLVEKIERTHYIASSFGVDPYDIFDLFDFLNQLVPPNWIIYEYARFPELKPGNLYIAVLPAIPEDWINEEVGASVRGPMLFQKISRIAEDGSEEAKTSLKMYGDGSIATALIEILVDDYDDLKWTMVHELAHIVVARRFAQKMHISKMHCGLAPNFGEDEATDHHGPHFQWAYDILIKRAEKIDDTVAEKCLNDLYGYKNPDDLYG